MTAAPTTRISLLLKLRDENDQVAWERFVTLYAPVVYGFARRKGLRDADAADMAQDVLLSVVQQMRKWTYSSERGSFRGWLFTIARNRLKNWRSSTARRMDATGGDDHHDALQAETDPVSDVEEWDAQYAQQVLHLAADIVREQVSEQTWLAFEMTALAGTSGAAAAESLGISVGAVYLARGRVMARLKEQVQQIGDE
jgi:RNA polymerase sigma-70 factor (ECF subfamily)